MRGETNDKLFMPQTQIISFCFDRKRIKVKNVFQIVIKIVIFFNF
jgi:hypothetical protein